MSSHIQNINDMSLDILGRVEKQVKVQRQKDAQYKAEYDNFVFSFMKYRRDNIEEHKKWDEGGEYYHLRGGFYCDEVETEEHRKLDITRQMD